MKFLILFLLVFVNSVNLNPILDGLGYLVNKIDMEQIRELNISKMCTIQIEMLQKQPHILLKMIDASSKFPFSGMMVSSRMDYGNFDECMSIGHNNNGFKIKGKYCIAGLVLPDITNITNIEMLYTLATCGPDACSAQDILTVSNALLFENFPPIFLDSYCTTKDTDTNLTLGTILVLFIIFLLLVLVALSSIYEVYCDKMVQKPQHPLLFAFSAISNIKDICKTSRITSKDNIQIFNGLRSISIAWIICAHGFQAFGNDIFPVMNHDRVIEIITNRESTYIFAADYGVTTFFFISGFLLSYLYFKRLPKNWSKQLKEIPVLFIYRYIRITVPVVVLYLLVVYVFDILGSGPLWKSGCEMEINKCKTYWWSFFLYIQNYVNWENLCLVPLWYLSADMQLFLLALLILIPITILLNRSNGFKYTMVSLAVVNLVFALLYIGIREIFPHTKENTFNTHGRLADYFIGFMMGIFLRLKKDEEFLWRVKRKYVYIFNILAWIGVLVPMFFLVLYHEDALYKFKPISTTLYFAFGRVIWATGLCWIVYSCYHGYGGFVNWFLCRPIFQILGKLSYGMYLLHYLVMGHYVYSNRMKWYASHYTEFYLYCGYYTETFILAFVWSLLIESPILKIQKIVFSRIKPEEVRTGNNINKTSESAA